MPVMRIVLLVLVVGGLTLFAFSNLSPVVSLVFLGTQTLALPLAAWMGIAIAAGALTSFFLQLLSYLQRGYSTNRGYATQSFEQPEEAPPQSRSFRRESPATPEPEPERRYSPPPPETPTNSSASDGSDWEERNTEDWDFDEEAAAPSSRSREFDRDSQGDSYDSPPRATPQDNPNPPTAESDRTSYELRQEPKTRNQSGTVYSYSYKKSSESGVGQTDVVYDANYRVITPPNQSTAKPEEDDEDWGFEDDEDFNDEYERERRPR